VYPLFGRPQDSIAQDHSSYTLAYPTYLGATFDASTTNLTYQLPGPKSDDEPIDLILSFLSPITPSSTLRQAIPAAYLTVTVKGSRDVNVYTDLNGEWVSGNRGNEIKWELSVNDPSKRGSSKGTKPVKTWKIARSEEQLLTEFDDRSEWGTLYFSGPSDVQHQSGTSAILRQKFAETGKLANKVDNIFRRIMEDEPVFAFSKSFKLGGDQKEDSVVFTYALVQEPVVQFASARGLTYMRPLWASYFTSPDELISYHYNDFETAKSLALNYSATLAQDAFQSGSKYYQEIVELSARQVLGATQFAGTPDDPILFLKEISSNGNFQTVDVIFPAFPFFLYTNPKWLGYLLEPLLEHQLSGQYPNDYSMHDLGYHFPNATGHPDGQDEYMPVEECGNMLIMALALANAYKDNSAHVFTETPAIAETETLEIDRKWTNIVDKYGMDFRQQWTAHTGYNTAEKWLARSYSLLKKWTGYLVRESLIPANQLCTDDFAGWLANQTNLALKGIIGIRAMSTVADLTGHAKDAEQYKTIADSYIEKWQEYAISRDQTHAKLAYTWYGSWTTIYNLYGDALLCFHIPDGETEDEPSGQKPLTGGSSSDVFIPDSVYQMESNWYHAVLQTYGLPLDSRHLYTKSDWEFFAAAVTSKKTRTEILNSIALWLNETSTSKSVSSLFSKFHN
jgi:hypothetical protein